MASDLPPLVDFPSSGSAPFIPPPPGASFGPNPSTGFDPFPGASASGFPSGSSWAQDGAAPNPFPGAATPMANPWTWALPTFAGTPHSNAPPWANIPPPFAPGPPGTPFTAANTHDPQTRSFPLDDPWNQPHQQQQQQQLSPWGVPPALQPAAGGGGAWSAPGTPWPVAAQTPCWGTPDSKLSNLTRSSSRFSGRGFPLRGFVERPSEWRRDFRVRPLSKAASLFRGLSLSTSSLENFSDGLKPRLHPYLSGHKSGFKSKMGAPMSLDLRLDPTSIHFAQLKRSPNQWDAVQFACDPPLRAMRLLHSRLPWYVDVYTDNPSGVTLGELILQVHGALMKQIRHRDFFNEEMDGDARAEVTVAYRERCEVSGDWESGVRRVDFLRGWVVWEGLARCKNGMWEMKTSRLT